MGSAVNAGFRSRIRARRAGRKLAFALSAALVLLLALSSAPAFAKLAHFKTGEFSANGGGVGGLAVDESTETVYVLAGGNLHKFTLAGVPAEFSSTKSSEIAGVGQGGYTESQIAVDNSASPAKGDIYVANSGEVRIYGSDGTYLGSLTGGEPTPEWGEPCGVAVDGAGNVLVGNYYQNINRYKPTSNPVTNNDYSGHLHGVHEVCNVAADSLGDGFSLHYYGGSVTEYSAAEFSSPEVGSGTSIGSDAAAASVSHTTNNIYLDENTNVATVVEYGPEGTLLESFRAKNLNCCSQAIAVDSLNEKVFVGTGGNVQIYSLIQLPELTTEQPTKVTETGAELHGSVNPVGIDTTCKLEYGESSGYGREAPCSPSDVGSGSAAVPVSIALTELNPGTKYHYRFVLTNAEHGEVQGPDQTVITGAKPTLEAETTLQIGITSGTLKAEINPHYWLTTYHFEYGTDSSYGTDVPLPDASLGTGSGGVGAVWTLLGLQPATTYHYRVVAQNSWGSVTGPDQSFTTFPAQASSTGACPNTNFRSEQRAYYLPDCRAYEMVSPVDKGSASVAAEQSRDQAAISGDAVSWYTPVAFSNPEFGDPEGSELPGAQYISQRGADGWATEPINPFQVAPPGPGESDQYVTFNADLSEGVFYALSPVTEESLPNVAEVTNLYVRKNLLSAAPGQYELLSSSVEPEPYVEANFRNLGTAFAEASADMSHITFENPNDLTTETQSLPTGVPHAYEWSNGEVHYVGILPDGKLAPESIIGKGAGGGKESFNTPKYMYNAITPDGKKVFFEAGKLSDAYLYEGFGETHYRGNLYARENGQTVQLNVSERTVPDTENPETAEFEAASADGSKVFFESRRALTNDVGTGLGTPNARNLYMYNFDAPEGERVSLISVDKDPEGYGGNSCGCGNDRYTNFDGMSPNGEYVYFTGDDVLVEKQVPINGEYLYVWHNGTVRAVVGHSAGYGQRDNWGDAGLETENTFRLTPDGKMAVFVDNARTAYEAAGASLGSICQYCTPPDQVFVYNYEANTVVCASCKPAGDAPGSNSEASFAQTANLGGLNKRDQYLNHPISNDGRYVFFDSNDALLPQATNGQWNVYEYDTVSQQLHMISSGHCACDSHFVDASPDGSNVFFTTNEKLVSVDEDTNADMYDARIDGGFEGQNIAAPVPCTGDACAGPAEHVPNFSIAASATFNGVGNPLPSLNPNATETIKETNQQKLAKALKACKKKKNSKKRAKCERQAQLKFGQKKPAKKSSKTKSAKHASVRAGR